MAKSLIKLQDTNHIATLTQKKTNTQYIAHYIDKFHSILYIRTKTRDISHILNTKQ